MEKRFIPFCGLLVSLVTIASCGGISEEPQAIDSNQDSIIGGRTANLNEFPSYAALIVLQRATGTYNNEPVDTTFASFMCGGTLISPRHVLTAGHCIMPRFQYEQDPANGTDLTIETIQQVVAMGRVDGTLINANWQTGSWAATSLPVDNIYTYQVQSGFQHPYYDPNTVQYDFGVLKLATASTRPTLQLADAASIAAGKIGKVVGWGLTSVLYDGSSTNPRYLQVIDSERILSNSECLSKSQGWIAYLANMNGVSYPQMYSAYQQWVQGTWLCVMSSISGKSTHHGDSGGPLLVSKNGSWVVGGLVSTGAEMAAGSMSMIMTSYPDLFAEVPMGAPWINSCVASDAGCF